MKLKLTSSQEVVSWGLGLNKTPGWVEEGADDHSVGLCASDPLVWLLTLTADISNHTRKGDVGEAESRDPDEHESNAALRSRRKENSQRGNGSDVNEADLKGVFSPFVEGAASSVVRAEINTGRIRAELELGGRLVIWCFWMFWMNVTK